MVISAHMNSFHRMFLRLTQNLISDSTFSHLASGFVFLPFLVKQNQVLFPTFPLQFAKGIGGKVHTCTQTDTPAAFKPVDILKLLLFKMSVTAEDKLFVSEEHRAIIRVRNGSYSD